MRPSDHLDGASNAIRAYLHATNHPIDLSIPEIARSLAILDELVGRLPQATRQIEAASMTQNNLGLASTGDADDDLKTIIAHLGAAAGDLHRAQERINEAHQAASRLYRPAADEVGE